MNRHRLIWTFIALFSVLCTALADDAQKLSKEELQQMIPGSNVSGTGINGDPQHWTNEPTGTFNATWENPPGAKRYRGFAPGSWRVSDDGKYCVHIEWKSGPVDWCAWIQKSSDGKLSLVSDGNSHLPSQAAISK